MEPWMWIAIAVVAVVVIAVVVWLLLRRRGRQLKKQFGPEYDRAMSTRDSRDSAHAELERRLERHERYELRSLDDAERAAYVEQWKQAQRHFTKQPATGLLEADDVLTRLLRDVGYPTDSFEQQAADLSVEHADVISDYREGQAVVVDVREGRAGTEEIRRALLRYRAVFEQVAGTGVTDDEAVS